MPAPQEAKKTGLLVPPSHYEDGVASPRSIRSLGSPSGGQTLRRKLVVIGDGACGKTSMLISYTNGSFPVMYVPTVFENYVASIPVDNHVVEMSLWDTAGQEDYDRIRPLSYTETSVLLICFALDMPTSLASVTNKWIDEVVRYCEGVPRILVGCKLDTRSAGRASPDCVSTQQAQEVADRIQAYKYIECSAKTGEGLNEVFEHAARASLLSRKRFKRSQKTSAATTPAPSTAATVKRRFCTIS